MELYIIQSMKIKNVEQLNGYLLSTQDQYIRHLDENYNPLYYSVRVYGFNPDTRKKIKVDLECKDAFYLLKWIIDRINSDNENLKKTLEPKKQVGFVELTPRQYMVYLCMKEHPTWTPTEIAEFLNENRMYVYNARLKINRIFGL